MYGVLKEIPYMFAKIKFVSYAIFRFVLYYIDRTT